MKWLIDVNLTGRSALAAVLVAVLTAGAVAAVAAVALKQCESFSPKKPPPSQVLRH